MLIFKILRVTLIIATLSSVAVITALSLWLNDLGVFKISEDSLATITDYRQHDNTVVFDRHQRKIGEYFDRYHVFIPYDQLPKKLVQAVLAIEDRNFFEHHGVDFRAVLRAGFETVRNKTYAQGASTLTQQLVRSFLLSREKTIQRKIQEIAYAIHLERKLPKERILELYVNTMFLGFGSYGIGAAAKRYFGKSLDQLETHELALIAGLFQSPSRYNPIRFPQKAKSRQLRVLKAMHSAQFLATSELSDQASKPLVYSNYQPLNTRLAPYFIDYVSEQAAELLDVGNLKSRGLRIHTTLHSELQVIANKVIGGSNSHFDKASRMVYKRKEENSADLLEAALLSIDPKTGEILAMVGGRDYAKSNFNRTVQAKRSPGSVFKPVVYSLALASGQTWSDVIFVSPVSVAGYKPRNYKESFLTESTLLRAFFLSLNTPTIEIGKSLGTTAILEQAERLGIKTTLKNEPGTMIGSSEVTMLDLATMYSTFSNGGERIQPIAITKITDRDGDVLYESPALKVRKTRALSPQLAYLMVRGMQDVFKHGTANAASGYASKAAGKTGTSNDSDDNWFAGFYPNLTTVVWLGTDDHRSVVDGTGSYLALPLWADFMGEASRHVKAGRFSKPEGITSARVHSQYGYLNSGGVEMYFLAGTEPTSRQSDLEILSGVGKHFRGIFDR